MSDNEMSRRVVSVICTVVAAVLLGVGVLAGVVNRQVLDGSNFARHVDAVRRDPAVSRQVGQAIAAQAITAVPDLVALRPLVEASATALAASPAFGPVVRASARQLHGSFTESGSGPVVWRLVDVGAALSGVVPVLSPQAAARLPPDLSVTLADAGSRSFAARTIHVAYVVGLLAWLLPVLALLGFAGALLVASDRLRAVVRVGWAVLWAGIGVGLVALAGELVASAADETTLHGALVAASWRQFGRPLWWAAAITAAAGGLMAAAASARVPQVDLAVGARRVWAAVTRVPAGRWARAWRGVALVAFGIGVLLRPALVFAVLAGMVGLVLLVAGVGELAAAAGVERRAPRERRRPARVPVVACAVVVALVAGLVVFDTAPVTHQITTSRGGWQRLQRERKAVRSAVQRCGLRRHPQRHVGRRRAGLVHPRTAHRFGRPARRRGQGAADRHLVWADHDHAGAHRHRAGESRRRPGPGRPAVRAVGGDQRAPPPRCRHPHPGRTRRAVPVPRPVRDRRHPVGAADGRGESLARRPPP